VKTCSIIDAPSDLGLRRTGVEGLPDALRAAGLLEGLPDVRYAGRLPVPPYVPFRDLSTTVLNLDGIRTFSLRLAERVAFTLDLGRFPLVLVTTIITFGHISHWGEIRQYRGKWNYQREARSSQSRKSAGYIIAIGGRRRRSVNFQSRHAE
jgi:hypothetical protein